MQKQIVIKKDYVFYKKDVKLNLAPKSQWAEASTSNASVYDIMKCPKIESESNKKLGYKQV